MLWWAWVGYAWLTSVDRPRGGRRPPGDVRVDGGAARRVAGRARCVRRPRPHLRHRVRARCGPAGSCCSSSPAPTRRRSGTRSGSGWCRAPRSASACWWRRRSSTAAPSSRCGASPWRIDMLGPFLFGSEGWKLEPHHFAERHGLIFIIALGESIVAIGVGSEAGVDAGVITAAVLGIALAATMWWAYFDVVAIVAARRLARAAGRARAERDGPRLVLVPPLPDGRRRRAHRPRHEEDDRPRRRAARPGDGVRAGRRPGDLPARPHRLPAPQRPLDQQAAPRARGRAGRLRPVRRPARRPRHPRDRRASPWSPSSPTKPPTSPRPETRSATR